MHDPAKFINFRFNALKDEEGRELAKRVEEVKFLMRRLDALFSIWLSRTALKTLWLNSRVLPIARIDMNHATTSIALARRRQPLRRTLSLYSQKREANLQSNICHLAPRPICYFCADKDHLRHSKQSQPRVYRLIPVLHSAAQA